MDLTTNHEAHESEPPAATGGRLRVVDSVHAALRDAILSGDIPQATVLSQVQLAKQFGVSRTPLREAVRMLQAEGLVEAVPNQRVRVSSVSVAELEQLYTLRIAVEALALRISVPRFTQQDFTNLHRLVEQLEACAEADDVDGWELPHQEFHRGLVSYAGARAGSLIERLQQDSNRYRRLYITHGASAWWHTTAEHAAILRFCESRDPAAAAAELARHYARSALTVIALVDPQYDPVGVRAAVAMVIPGQGADVPVESSVRSLEMLVSSSSTTEDGEP
jgi:DNA-binding GntR family transcriptional regulator